MKSTDNRYYQTSMDNLLDFIENKQPVEYLFVYIVKKLSWCLVNQSIDEWWSSFTIDHGQ